ncbi:MAG: ABC transporter ATP-binding protein [Deltaproteobacteria bacterium]|nr:MAG: ABC transporter ATP-binding protein [Deltaproteobacteria bacterium]
MSRNMAENAIIHIMDIKKSFAGVQALNGVSFSVPEKGIFGLIGPNGAGKTTLINVINGVYKPDEGEIQFGTVRLNDMAIYDIAQLGISRTFQVARIFRRMSVLENMVAPTIFLKESSERIKNRVMELLDFVGLSGKRDQYAFELSGGQQKLLEFARALVTDPQLVLMDEPFAGVHPEIKAQLIDNIKELNKEGKTFIIVSHDMRSISDLCTQLVVLNFGEKLTEGPPEEVLTDEQVIEAYLGE